MEERKWCCVNCGWTTTDNTLRDCPDCTDMLMLIPKRLDVALALAVNEMESYYRMEAVLNQQEDTLELEEIGSGKILYRIRNWEDFAYFFGNYWYSKYNYSERTDSTE